MRVQALLWHSAVPSQEAELSQQTLRLLQRRRCPRYLLWAKTQLHQRTLRYRILSQHPTLRLQKAELHQQALRLLCQRRWVSTFLWARREPSSTKKHCNIKLCRGPLLCDSRKPRVQTRLCDLTRWTSNATPSWIGNVSPSDPADSAKCEGASQLLREHERIENDESWRPSPSLTANASGWKRDFRAKEPFGVGLRKRNVVHGVAEGDRTSGTRCDELPK